MKFWTKDRIKQEALKYNSRNEFNRNSPSAYQLARKDKILDEVCRHMTLLVRRPYTLKDLKEIALKYNSRGEFQELNGPAYGSALNKGVLEEICSHMMSSATKPYTVEEIHEEAKKFETRKAFQLGSPAYKAAWRRGILDEVCSHMPKHVDQSGENSGSFKWKNEEIQKEALKYDKRIDFKFGSPQAYDVAQQRKMLDKICSHMKRAINVSGPELELFERIREIYPSTTTLRIRDVKIKEKPYIKGFYLDIYIPELNKGIEFDGRWHHSVEGLKRSRKLWPIEDILNYHKLKDDHFASKGIQLLHIKEEDWIMAKEGCIQKCLSFLSSK
jgi:hypothetical protein